MKKPEEVLGGKKSSTHKDKKKKHYKETRIEHHHDGSHTVRHTPADGDGDELSYAAPDMAAVHAGLDNNVGAAPPAEPNPGTPEGGAPPPGGAPPAA
jgi:hypothetical protein